MTVQEIYNGLKSSIWFYILIFIIILIVVLLIFRGNKKKKINKQIESYQIKINELKSHPFAVDIAKMDAIAKVNNSILSTAQQCKKDFDLLQDGIKNSVSLLQDASENVETNNFNACKQNLEEIDSKLNECEKLTAELDTVLNGILNQATQQRKRINELKSEFHDIKERVNNNPNAYTYSWEMLDVITNRISHQFSDFEAIMETSKYDEAATQAEQISLAIENLNQLIQQLPELVVLAKNTIPAQLNELNSNYLVALSNGTYLKHLSIPQNMDEIKKETEAALQSLKKCEIANWAQKLSDCQAKINQLTIALINEKEAYNELLKIKKECENNMAVISESIDKVKNSESASIERYNLSEIHSRLSDVSDKYKDCASELSSLNNSLSANITESSQLVVSYRQLAATVKELLKESREMTEMISLNRREEMRARELISRFIVVLNESKASIKLSRLPNISQKYNEDIIEAERHIAKLNTMLQNSTIDIEKLNNLLDETQTIIINLYKNVNALVKTTKYIEDFIVLTNRYRAYCPEVDSMLYSAELAYRNGEYTKACKLTASALSLIEPQMAQKLNAEINEKINEQKEK
ncbi:MAG: septation ring formation regulator EzrA [Erysipelotrichia bacterium]|nr:septation ring formation regulator EzrA [Erysipelotrichia bacterium]